MPAVRHSSLHASVDAFRRRAVLRLIVGTVAVVAVQACERSGAPVTVDSVEVTPAQRDFTGLGETATFTAVARDANGTRLDGRTISWSSADAAVASVSESGVATAVGYGSTRITASAEGRSGTADVTVLRPPVASVTVEPDEATVLEGETVQLEARVRDAGGNLMTDRAPAWSSSDPAIAAVSGGVVTGVRAGTATITATLDGQSGTAGVTVAPQPVASVTVEPAAGTIEAGASIQLAALVRDAENRVLVGRTVTWASANAAVATVDAAGKVTGVAGGTVVITATSEGKAGTATVTVLPRPVASVVILPNAITIGIGATTQLAAQARAADGTLLDGRAFAWSSAAPAIAGIDAMGRVIAIAAGVATITATSEGVSGTAVVTVVQEAVASVVVTPPTATITVGGTVQLSAQTLGGTGSPLPGRPVAWSSANGAIATVDTDGTVTGSAPGTVVITATSEGRTGTATVTVQAVVPQSITITPATATIAVGGTIQLQAVARDAGGNAIPGKTFTWTGSACATVDASGLVTGVALGSCTVSAMVDGVAASATITVVQVPVATVTVTPTSATVKVGGMTPLVAAAFDASGGPLTGRTFTWTTSDGAVATVDATGKVTGVSPGMATITATAEGKSAAAAITVVIPPVAAVVVTPATANVTVNGMVQLAAQARDADGDPIAGKTFTWTTSDAALATVNATGRVTGVAQGTATITATADGQSGSATVTVVPPPAAGSLACGAVVSGSIGAAGETDVLTFAGATGQTVTLTLTQTGGFTPGVVARVTVLRPNGTQLVQFNATSQQDLALAETGTYTVHVTASNTVSTGQYNIGLECICAPLAADGSLVPGDLLSASLAIPAEVDVYTLDGSAGDVFLLTLTQTGGFTPGVVARTRILTPGCGVLTTFNATSQQRVTLPSSGTYVLLVYATNLFHGGTYNLGVERLDPLGPIDGTMAPGDILSAAIANPGEVDLYTFSGQSGDDFLFTLTQTGGFTPGVVARATIIAPSGAQVIQFNATSQHRVSLTETGTFIVYFNATNLFHGGSYNFGVERLDPLGPIDGTVAPGDILSAVIASPAEVDIHTFSAQSGDDFLFTLTQTGGFTPGVVARATIIAPSGAQVIQFNATSQHRVSLTETGTFIVYFNATNLFHGGSYSLGVERLDPLGPTDGTVAPGEILSGAIAAAAEVDIRTFTGQSGDQFLFTLTQTGGFTPGVVARATILAPSGAQLAQFNATSQQRLTLSESGTFVVYFNATNLFHTGSYSLGVERLVPLGPTDGSLAPGDLVSGAIANAAEVDIFTFSGQSGTSTLLTLVQTGGFTPGVVARATVIAPSGAQVDQFNANTQNRSINLSESGTYIVYINATNLFHTGTYNIGRQ